MQQREKLIVSLDVSHFDHALSLVKTLSPIVDCFKVGIGPHTAFGDAILEELIKAGKKVFLDLKFHDIPNTVKNATTAAANKGIYMVNFHCLGGQAMLEAAREGIEKSNNKNKPLLIGVTILTSMGSDQLSTIGLEADVQTNVIRLAKLAEKSGMDGVVCSAQEAAAIKQEISKEFLTVCPGIRPAQNESPQDDQRRIVTPKKALENGADYLVIGRPIIAAENPLVAAKEILEEMA